MFWKKRKIIIITTIIVTILGIIYSFYLVNPKYKSSATLLVGKNTIPINDVNSMETDKSEIKSENTNVINKEEISYIVKSNALLSEVKDNLRIDVNEEDLKQSIKISKISKTELVKITVINRDSKLAADTVNEIANSLLKRIQQLYNTTEVHVVDYAYPSNEPYNVNHILDITVFFLVGITISLIYIFVTVKLDKRIKNVLEVETETGLKVLSSVPSANARKNRLEIFENNEDIVKKSFDTLKTNIQFGNINDKENKTVLITSCYSSEGRSYITANLGVTFAKEGKKVVIIDTDMRRSVQSKIFNVNNDIGFSNYLSNIDKDGNEINDNINKILNETEIKNLNIITSGSTAPNHSELLSSDRLPKLIKDLSNFYDLVILDGPPVLPMTDSLILARLVSSTIIVSLYKRTKTNELLKAKIDIKNAGGKITGVVLNGSKKIKTKRAKVKKEEKVAPIDKIEFKLRFKDFKEKTALLFKNVKQYIKEKYKKITSTKVRMKEDYSNYKIKKEEEQKIKQEEKIKKAELKENRKELKIEEKTKFLRIREEEKIRQQKIKELEKEKKDIQKREMKSKKELEKQKQKEEIRIKEELSEDNLYPKIKNII